MQVFDTIFQIPASYYKNILGLFKNFFCKILSF